MLYHNIPISETPTCPITYGKHSPDKKTNKLPSSEDAGRTYSSCSLDVSAVYRRCHLLEQVSTEGGLYTYLFHARVTDF